MKRWRSPEAKPGEIKVRYGKLQHDAPDICYAWGEGTSKADTYLLHYIFSSVRFRPGSFETDISLYDELEKRGYDLETIKFSIQKKIRP
jgi:hypothetical protein